MKSGRLQPSQGKRSARPKKAAARRDWVSTVNDLSVHKSTPAELVHRHEIHKSHNSAVAQWELKEKSIRRHHRVLGTPSPMDQASLSIIREVFSDQLLLQDVLARSDRAMAVVKDLFGDAPRRQTGHPRVTMAPDCDSDSELPVVRRADPPTQLSLLSHSTMTQQALNELEESEEEHSEEGTPPAAIAGPRPRADLCRMRTRTGPGGGPPRPIAKPSSRPRGLGASGQTPPGNPGPAPDPAALNVTVAVQRVRTQTSQSEAGQEAGPGVHSPALNSSGRPGAAPCRQRKTCAVPLPPETPRPLDGSAVSLSGTRSSLDLLQGMLGRVEEDLDSMGLKEPQREGQPSSEAGPPPRTQGLTGFSVALVSTLSRLVHHLRQREEEAQREVVERRRLEEEVLDQRGLIDALSAESLVLREESTALQVCLLQRTSELEQRLDRVVQAMGGLDLLGGLLGAPNDSLPLSHSPDYGSDSLYAGCKPHLTQGPTSSAVLLSPPQQRDPHGPPERGPSPRYDCPHHGARGHREVNSLSSSSTLPPVPMISDPEGRPPFSEEALVVEIMRLSQQNQCIKEQLTQARAVGLALGHSSDPPTATASSYSWSSQSRALGSALSHSPDPAAATASSSCSSQSRGSCSSGSTGRVARVRRAESAGPQRENQQDHMTGGGPLESPEEGVGDGWFALSSHLH